VDERRLGKHKLILGAKTKVAAAVCIAVPLVVAIMPALAAANARSVAAKESRSLTGSGTCHFSFSMAERPYVVDTVTLVLAKNVATAVFTGTQPVPPPSSLPPNSMLFMTASIRSGAILTALGYNEESGVNGVQIVELTGNPVTNPIGFTTTVRAKYTISGNQLTLWGPEGDLQQQHVSWKASAFWLNGPDAGRSLCPTNGKWAVLGPLPSAQLWPWILFASIVAIIVVLWFWESIVRWRPWAADKSGT
jgi:hypothetical protein